MVKCLSNIFILLVILSFPYYSQRKDSISTKNRELQQIKQEIAQLEKELSNKTKKEKETLEFLERSNRQSLLIQKLINNLIAEEKQKTFEIQKIEEKIGEIENKISLLRERYSRYIVWIYKNRNYSTLKFILNAGSLNQMLKRFRYLKLISKQNKKDLRMLSDSKINLMKYKALLQKEKEEKEILVAKKMEEQKKLEILQAERNELIATLRKDKKILAAEIDSKRKAEVEIKKLILSLVEKERLEKTRQLEKKLNDKTVKPAISYTTLENFEKLKGKMIWPVKNGKIVRRFGENKNDRLNTITINYGVDISTKQQKEIYAVAEGVVSAVEWIPGFGSVVIISHNNEFRTVYGHITNITVKEGDLVKSGTVIGKVSESLEGNILHFEIWNERNYQNPETWLAKR
ncbi:murein hydrolase activator EnvC family protein [Rosettibacter firmus]|uniref:murein hydrolase activator EnvC family protein n=1 Tax=Rosettibacter firmus TaxID=3111522 RepID=UPI00336BD63F